MNTETKTNHGPKYRSADEVVQAANSVETVEDLKTLEASLAIYNPYFIAEGQTRSASEMIADGRRNLADTFGGEEKAAQKDTATRLHFILFELRNGYPAAADATEVEVARKIRAAAAMAKAASLALSAAFRQAEGISSPADRDNAKSVASKLHRKAARVAGDSRDYAFLMLNENIDDAYALRETTHESMIWAKGFVESAIDAQIKNLARSHPENTNPAV